MSRVFDAYYKKAVLHEWQSHRHVKPLVEPLVEADETIIRSYNEIWQPAVDFTQEQISNLPTESEGTNDKWFLEALYGVLMDNKIEAEDAESIDNKIIRQKIDGLTAKIDSMAKDAPSGEISTYIETFSSGMKSFKNRIDALEQPDPAAPEEANPEQPPEGEQPAPKGGEEQQPNQPAQPPPDQNSQGTLLKDLNFT